MPKTTLFAPRTDANKITLAAEKTFGEFLTTHSLQTKLDDVALYNWGTKQPREINRMLVERLGCTKVDDDPLKSALDPAFALVKFIHKPEPWKPAEPLEVEKTHQIKVRQRFPVPAIAIAKLTRWFKPETEACEIEYLLEGVASRAKDVDVEVHPARYYKFDKETEVPSDTHGDAGSRRLMQKRGAYKLATTRVPADAQKFAEWKGKSDATEGVLKNTFINAGCAPYNVHLRYYKEKKDENACILLKPFYPRWKPGTTTELLASSMIVEWEIKDDNDKLKGGQLVIWDKDGKVVFFAPLDAKRLRDKKEDANGKPIGPLYDLLNDTVKKWDAKDVKQDAMPYRAQLQAHSDEFEGDGLAIAVMPTQVRAFNYTKVQFIALNATPGYVVGNLDQYLGDADDKTDIQARCKEMKTAIAKAFPQADTSENVLKVFMAPEFFFRGAKGAYNIENVTLVRHYMAEEIEKVVYADWLFVYGTAIGMLTDGSSAGIPRRHDGSKGIGIKATVVTIKLLGRRLKLTCTQQPKVGWSIVGHNALVLVVSADGDDWDVTLSGPCAGVRENDEIEFLEHHVVIRDVTGTGDLTIDFSLGDRIQAKADSPVNWKIYGKWSNAVGEIVKVTKSARGPSSYDLGIKVLSGTFRREPAALDEPKATEVFNLALVQKGWPALLGGEHDVKAAVVYKEYVSHVDYVKWAVPPAQWSEPHGYGRGIMLESRETYVLPSSGSRDILGLSPNKPDAPSGTWKDKAGREHVIGSEVSATGIGGGIVFTIDGVTFGLEVCLDHGKHRLADFYVKKEAATGDPKPQVHLIPAWGMSIGGGGNLPVDAANPLLIFNVDGSRHHSVARLNDGMFSCDSHPSHVADVSADCPELSVWPYCSHCNDYDSTLGKCRTCSTVLVARHLCVEPKQYDVCPTCREDGVGDCANGHASTAREPAYYCAKPVVWYRCPTCGFVDAPACPRHGATGSPAYHRCLRELFYACKTCRNREDLPGPCPAGCGQMSEYRYCRRDNSLFDSRGNCPSCHNPGNPCGPYLVADPCKHMTLQPEQCGFYAVGGTCSQPSPDPEICGRRYDASGSCHHCGATTPKECKKPLKPIGTFIRPTVAEDALALPATHFEKEGFLTIYPVKDLPKPGVVPPP